MASEYGFIYVLGNEAMPGLCKIGYTMGHPKNRMQQLSAPTSCPTPFYMLACFGVRNPQRVEREMHQRLEKFRVNGMREFFKCDLVHVQQLVRENAEPNDDLYMAHRLDDEVDMQEEQRT